MMISPEAFYENEVNGKNAEQIKEVITGLKRKIAELKRTMEHPGYAPTTLPAEDAVLWCNRLYIERAKVALEQIGEKYEPTASEIQAMEFDRNIPNIAKIVLEIHSFFGGWCEVTVDISDTVNVKTNILTINPMDSRGENYELDKDELLDALEPLHLGEWQKSYDAKRFGIYTLDGFSWELRIEYNNGRKPFVSVGNNAYPYNFEMLTDSLGVDLSDYLG